jgi:hypothetical protein
MAQVVGVVMVDGGEVNYNAMAQVVGVEMVDGGEVNHNAMPQAVGVVVIDVGVVHHNAPITAAKPPSQYTSRQSRLTNINGMAMPCKRGRDGSATVANPSSATYGGVSSHDRYNNHTRERTVEKRQKPHNPDQIAQIACGKVMMPSILPFRKCVLFRSLVTGMMADKRSPIFFMSKNNGLGVYVLNIENVSIVFRFLIEAMCECVQKNDVEQEKYAVYKRKMFTIFTLVGESKPLDVSQKKLYTSFRAMLQTAGFQPEMLSCYKGGGERGEGRSMRSSKNMSWLLHTRWHLTMEYVIGTEGVLRECSYSSFFDLDIANFPVGVTSPETMAYKSPFHKLYVDIYNKTAPLMYADK